MEQKNFRFRVFEEFAKSKLSGLIFTFVWALDVDEDRKYVQEIVQIFRTHKRSMYFVELEAERKERLRRNNTTDRLAEKPSKRNIELSKQRLLEADKKFILNTKQDNLYLAKELLQASHFLKIDNTHLQPKQVALQIKNYFKF